MRMLLSWAHFGFFSVVRWCGCGRRNTRLAPDFILSFASYYTSLFFSLSVMLL